MKKNLWIWALAALSMTACTSEDAPSQEQVVTENDWESPDGRVVVQLSADGLPIPSASVGRAVGAIEGEDISKLDSLGIFALNRGGGFTDNANSEILLNNVRARGKGTTTLDEDIHVSEKDGEPLKRISLYSDDDKYKNENGKVASIYYYPVVPTCHYDFYGYYPRQEDAKVTHTDDEFTVTFRPTDGSMDIITGKSDKAPVMWKGKLYAGIDKDTKEVTMNEDDLYGYNSKYIRSIKYHNWLMDTEEDVYREVADSLEKQRFVPNIKFEHRTALLQFYVVANDKQAGAEEPPYNDREETTNLRVFDITLEDVNTVAKWKVKANELDWDTPDDLLMKPLVQADYEAMKPAAVNMSDVWETKTFKMEVDGEEKEVTKATIKPAIQKGEQCHQAGYLLVQPKGDYKVTLSILAPTGDDADAGDAVPMTQTTTLDIPTVFKAGFRYKVYIQLNALQEVNIHAELKDWEDYKDDIDIPVE